MRNRSVMIVVSSLCAGGAERIASEIANEWSSQGLRTGLLTFSNASADHYSLHAGVNRYTLDRISQSKTIFHALISNLRRIRAIREAVCDFGPSAVISFTEQVNAQVLCAMLWSGVPVIVSERIDPRAHKVPRVWNIARKWLYPRAAALVVQTRSVALWAHEVVAQSRVKVIPNFVRDFATDVPRSDGHFILGVGRLVHQKGFDILLRAYAASSAPALGYSLRLVGSGPELTSLRALAERLGIAHRVNFVGITRAPEADMGAATIFVLSSRYEGFPNVLVEAMALGCAVIATDCPSGPAEIVVDGESGLLVPVDDVTALSKAIDELLRSESRRATLGQAALRVRETLAKERVLSMWLDLVMRVSRE